MTGLIAQQVGRVGLACFLVDVIVPARNRNITSRPMFALIISASAAAADGEFRIVRAFSGGNFEVSILRSMSMASKV
jgi:hypothetical protein